MHGASGQRLTKRQLAVLKRIDRRVPIKVIAQELSVSETRINQHIRALKDIYQVDSLNELVECYRRDYGDEADAEDAKAKANSVGEAVAEAFSESAYRKTQLPAAAGYPDSSSRVDPGEIVMSDVMALNGIAPWDRMDEPQIVPGVLDGPNAVVLRLATIVGIAFGCLAAVVLTVTAAITISEALEGKATIPVDEQGFS